MCDQKQTERGFYCDMLALPGEIRTEHVERSKRIFSANGPTTSWTDMGFEMSLDKSVETLVELAKWANYESLCCPFLKFDIQIRPDSGPIILRVTEPEGARGFLRNELVALGVV